MFSTFEAETELVGVLEKHRFGKHSDAQPATIRNGGELSEPKLDAHRRAKQ
jgi:hypothetical protein